MRHLATLLLFSCLFATSQAQPDTTRLLFLGNSLTFGNDIPGLVQALADSGGIAVYYEQSTPGGEILENHANSNATSINKLAAGDWDYVILQEQSQIPLIPHWRYNNMYPAIRDIDNVNRANCSRTVMFQVYARKNGGQQCDPNNVHCSAPLPDYWVSQDTMSAVYQAIADELQIPVVPVGEAWRRARQLDSTLTLWTGDNLHPAYAGSYLSACTFYAALLKDSVSGNPFHGSLDSTTASFLQSVADTIVFSNLSQYRLDTNAFAITSATIDSLDSLTYQLAAGISFTDSSYWLIEGQRYPALATHSFADTGTFDISFIAINRCDTLSWDTSLTIAFAETDTSLSRHNTFSGSLAIYPNPTTGDLSIHSATALHRVEAFHLTGERVLAQSLLGQRVYRLALPQSGIYLLRLTDTQGRVCVRRIAVE